MSGNDKETKGRETIEAEAIRDLIPHRYPFLLVDRVLEHGADHGIGIKNVTVNEPFFQGHFPQFSVMPGVLIVEALAQLAGIIDFKARALKNELPFFAGINGIRFREPVRPGDQLILEVRITKRKARLLFVNAKARVGDKVVCEGELVFAAKAV